MLRTNTNVLSVASAILLSPALVTRSDERGSGTVSLDDLRRVAVLEPNQYRIQRDAILRAHPEEWDVAEAVEHSWEAGLIALILNARLHLSEQAGKWDGLQPIDPVATIRGELDYNLEQLGIGDYRVFAIEEIWKPRVHKIRYMQPEWVLTRGRVLGPLALWYRVWQGGRSGPMRRLAINAIAGDESDQGRDAIAAILENPNSPQQDMIDAISRLGRYRPAYAADVLFSAPQTNPDLPGGWRVLTWLGDPRARKFLRERALDPKLQATDAARLGALGVLSTHPAPEDMDIVRNFLYAPDSPRSKHCDEIAQKLPKMAGTALKMPGEFKKSAIDILLTYPIELARPLIHEVLRNPPAPEVFWYLVRGLPEEGHALSPEERELLQALQKADKVPELAREEVNRVLAFASEAEKRNASPPPADP